VAQGDDFGKLRPRLLRAYFRAHPTSRRDISRVTIKSLREQIAMVPRKLTVSDTGWNNISYGLSNISEEQVVAAAKAALAHVAHGRSARLHTLIGERGTRSVATAPAHAIATRHPEKSPILILDEATSRAGMPSPRERKRALGNLMIAAPRLCSAQVANIVVQIILVLEDGQIRERGNTRELIATGGT